MKSKRNGEGIEYNNDGKIIFKGYYLKGKRNGEGIEYNNDGKIIFKGQYLDGKKSYGFEYDNDGNLIYEYSKETDGEIYDDYDKFYENEYSKSKNNKKHKKKK